MTQANPLLCAAAGYAGVWIPFFVLKTALPEPLRLGVILLAYALHFVGVYTSWRAMRAHERGSLVALVLNVVGIVLFPTILLLGLLALHSAILRDGLIT